MLTDAVAVVVPAHDEEALLPDCLASLQRAAAQPGLPPVRILVVADGCQDGTVAVARRAGVQVLETGVRSAGAARRRGFEVVVGGDDAGPDRLWLATTDADSRVPPEWFLDQLAWHAQGFDAVLGTVEVQDWSAHDAVVAERFAEQYRWTSVEHPHVHGANLSLSAAAYRAVGGFPPLALAEEHALLAALEAGGFRVARTARHPVVTSARRDARCVGGFGTLLRTLAAG